MEVAMTDSAVITPMTEKTPMATPSMVSAERSLLLRRAVRAMRTVSFMACCRLSVVGCRLRADNRQPMTDNYSYRSASMGSSRAALMAGRMPDRMPVMVETIRPRNTRPNEKVIGNDGNAAATDADIRSEEGRAGK